MDLAVAIAMSLMGMMQMAVDQIIHMIAMRYGLVTAIGPVLVFGAVRGAVVAAGAGARIRAARFELVLVYVTVVKRVQMAVVKIVGMPIVEDGGVATAGAVLMLVVLVNIML